MIRIDDRWTERTLEWIQGDAKRPRRRPPKRWGDVFATWVDQLRAELDTAQGISSPSLTKFEDILDDNGEGMKRVEEMLGLAHPVNTGHLSFI
ncbi:hypothetical protein RB195_010650 [Necator americanus]|uniref:Uncharacterized protein n=1 Tax=Necator americanus TaxID=51031 RepID=A0ABR1CZA0_NECAM